MNINDKAIAMKALIGAALLCAASASHAGFWDGNKLYQYMTEASGSFARGAATGFVIGVHDSGENVSHCSPESITVRQVFDVVRAHLEQYPSLRHNDAQVIVSVALQRVWPCQKKPAQQGNPA